MAHVCWFAGMKTASADCRSPNGASGRARNRPQALQHVCDVPNCSHPMDTKFPLFSTPCYGGGKVALWKDIPVRRGAFFRRDPPKAARTRSGKVLCDEPSRMQAFWQLADPRARGNDLPTYSSRQGIPCGRWAMLLASRARVEGGRARRHFSPFHGFGMMRPPTPPSHHPTGCRFQGTHKVMGRARRDDRNLERLS